MTGHRAEHETVMVLCVLSTATDAQQVVKVEFRFADGASDLQSLRPFGLDGSDRKEQRSWKIALAADAGLLEGFLGRHVGHLLGETDRRERFDGDEIHRPGHRCFQAIDRKACHGPDAGFARGQLRPIIGLAGAERGDDAHSGDDDDRPAEFVAWCCHDFPRRCCP